ncbi:MAG: FAD:protein FMN transferase [Chitinophagaceae bacterium]|jgi:thiamine biosynthesis lipoprotein|nr:FAD:protein FMN transferase [Chitinophagaceae bacterium]MBK7678990.1 FAD:protein FMN transferase [Chitinophagaceae bacterium]MBK8299666.1 FAD:protein FMN transferase [Chitinophagaceae bacterium]MBK9659166.1 FAD:protein FMN transferase [Chitinophagaceae bacterium]MBK9937310.1 FAD:protein FMN transferase [Chitinophagaceae bacterium]
MGNRFEITVVADNEKEGLAKIDDAVAEISRIEKLLTTFNESSQTNLINRNAGIAPVKVDREVFDIIHRSKRISDVTQGAFDITYGSVDKKLWNFDKNMTSLPDAETAKKAVHLINYRNVILDEKKCTVFLKEKGMRIGFGGIGKGYAAERAKYILQQKGVESGIVNAAGDLTAWGYQPNGKEWTIGIADPDSAHHPFSYLSITDMAIATSGNYEKFITINGKRYSHTIDPKTGLPVTGIKSVTIISPNAEVADAMATPVMIMGIKVGLDMVNQVKGLACIIVDENDKIYTSKNINLK